MYPPNEHGYIPPKGCWEGIDERFQWRTVDEDGDSYFYGEKPTAGECEWACWDRLGCAVLYKGEEDLTIDWTKTLTKRPEGV